MKIKIDHVTNSSSTAFTIWNNTNKELDLVAFVKENPQLIEMFRNQYRCNEERYIQKNLITSAKENNEVLKPGDNYVVFGDEQDTLIGEVFDYILRDGGSSKRFTWEFCEWQR